MSQSSAFDRTQFGNVLDNHSDFRATRYRRQADKGEEEFARNDGSVLEGADWDNGESHDHFPLPPMTYVSCTMSSDGDVGGVPHFATVRLSSLSRSIRSPVS